MSFSVRLGAVTEVAVGYALTLVSHFGVSPVEGTQTPLRQLLSLGWGNAVQLSAGQLRRLVLLSR